MRRAIPAVPVLLAIAMFPAHTTTQSAQSPFDKLHFRDIGPAVTSEIGRASCRERV